MTFKEEFPNFTGAIFSGKEIHELVYKGGDAAYVNLHFVETQCLDKQRVKEIILALEEEWFLTINEEDNKKASHITKTLLGELKL